MAFFAARQPIFNADKSIFAYELLFRDGLENVFPDIDDDQATSKMIAGLGFNLGLETLTQDKLAFINFTHDTLLDGYPMLLPKDQVVVEVLETVKPGKKLLAAVKELKDKGYIIALDDYEHSSVWRHFYPFTDIIKIDYQAMNSDEIKEVIAAIKDYPHIKLLAEKVENHEEYQEALDLGFHYFQGYFFAKPEILKSETLKPSHISLGALMAEMTSDDPNINNLVQAFEADATLSFKLLRYAQSPIFKRRADISTIKQAIVALGQQELRRFVSLLFIAQVAQEKPQELNIMSLIRARFCESSAKHPGQREEHSSAFLVGLLSLLDAMLDADLAGLLDKLPLADHIKLALIEDSGVLSQYLNLVRSFEKADWDQGAAIAESLGICFEKAGECYQEAIAWAAERTGTS